MGVRKRVDYTDTAGCSNITCPFFKGHGAADLICEGLVSKDVINRFDDEKKRRNWEKRYCEQNHERCWFYRLMLSVKYREEGD